MTDEPAPFEDMSTDYPRKAGKRKTSPRRSPETVYYDAGCSCETIASAVWRGDAVHVMSDAAPQITLPDHQELLRRLLADGTQDAVVVRNLQGRSISANPASAQHEGVVHLLLTDVVMPTMNGRTLAERLNATRPGLKPIFMSGYTSDPSPAHGTRFEGTAFLQNPSSPEALAQLDRRVLDAPC